VTGKTMAENLAEIDPPAPDGTVVYTLSNAIDVEGGLNVLTGSLAPKGAVVKVAGLSHDQRVFEGPARVFEGEDGAMDAILAGRSSRARSSSSATKAPRAARACARCWPSPARSKAWGAVTIAHSSPTVASAAARGVSASATCARGGRRWPIAFVEDGDRIRVDVPNLRLDLVVDDATIARRKTNWKLPEPRYTSGFLAKYAKLAQGAEKGAITL
jgi:dihydroxy-acid dehydratase